MRVRPGEAVAIESAARGPGEVAERSSAAMRSRAQLGNEKTHDDD